MRNLLYLLPAIGCPVGIGVMMSLMMRPEGLQSDRRTPGRQEQEFARLRGEVVACARSGHR
jgi:hypothetical protein